MSLFVPGDLAVGGVHGYVEIIHKDTTFAEMVHVTPLSTGAGDQPFITGVTFRTKTGDLYTVSTPDLTAANCPHDVVSFPNDTGLLVAVCVTSGQLDLHKYSYANPPVLLDSWTSIPVEDGWTNALTRIDLACDSRTMFFSQQGHRLMRYDLVSRAALDDYETLPDDSPYIYGGLRVLPGGSGDNRRVIVAMTLTGDGPQRAVCLESDRTSFWVDEINPSDGVFHVQKRKIADRALITSVETRADEATPTPTNDATLSLASYYTPCGAAFEFAHWLG